MPTTSPSAVTSGPPELPGIGRRVELDQIGQHALALAASGTRAAGRTPRPPTPTGRCRTGSPTATTSSPSARSAVERSVAAARSSGIVFACSTARSCSGRTPMTVGLGLRCRRRTRTLIRSAPATTCRLVRMMPLSTITTPVPTPSLLPSSALFLPVLAALRILRLGVAIPGAAVLARLAVRVRRLRAGRRRVGRLRVAEAADAHDAAPHRLVGLRRGRRQRVVLQRVQHRGVDVLLGEPLRPGRQRRVAADDGQRDRRTGGDEQRALVAGEPGAWARQGCRGGARGRWLGNRAFRRARAGERVGSRRRVARGVATGPACPARTAVERDLLHRAPVVDPLGTATVTRRRRPVNTRGRLSNRRSDRCVAGAPARRRAAPADHSRPAGQGRPAALNAIATSSASV